MSRLSRQCGILNISQPYRPPRPIMGIALLYFTLLYFTSFSSEGDQPLHNNFRHIFCKVIENLTAYFTTSSPMICPRASQNVSLLPRHSSHPRPRSLMTLMHLGSAQHLFPNICSLWFCVHHHPCMVSEDHVPCMVQEHHGKSSTCGHRPTSGAHHHPGTISLAVRALAWCMSLYCSSSVPTVST
jgi:hypothetical protein